MRGERIAKLLCFQLRGRRSHEFGGLLEVLDKFLELAPSPGDLARTDTLDQCLRLIAQGELNLGKQRRVVADLGASPLVSSGGVPD